MGLNKPLISEIAYKTWMINELGCNNMYVLEGTERSLVIDAGMGYCEFRKIVESLTDKPYDVVITHAHPDHIGMMRQFERIYVNRKEITDAPARKLGGVQVCGGGMEAINWLTRPDFDMDEFVWNNRQHMGNWEVWTPDESVICRGNLDTEICYIDEGCTFDLGGRVVTGYNLPGHSPGHMYFVDSGSRIAFTGDCVNFNNGTRFHAASTHIRYLQKLLSMYGKEYNRIFTGHSTYCGQLDVFSQDIRIIENLMEMHRAYLRDEVSYVDVVPHLHPEMPPIRMMTYGEGKFRVQANIPPRKWEEGETEVVP